mmetsp:Transcript_99517/g.201834  ORF Transcript_99517/g.201834 Transcript_99517/m.201834 type:complete len:216 (-) Transcript_99517:7-654(-)
MRPSCRSRCGCSGPRSRPGSAPSGHCAASLAPTAASRRACRRCRRSPARPTSRPVARDCPACGGRRPGSASGSAAAGEEGQRGRSGRGGAQEAERAAELADEYGRAFSRGLISAGGPHPEGFEDDPITYLTVGWSGGPLPSRAEAELGRRLARVFREDALQQVQGHFREEAKRRRTRNLDAYQAWSKRKAAEARLRRGGGAVPILPAAEQVAVAA